MSTKSACYDLAESMRLPVDFRPLHAAVIAAATLPALLAFNQAPSPTFLNQALAFLTWGWVALAVALEPGLPSLRASDVRGGSAAALSALAIIALSAAAASAVGDLPSSLGLSGVGSMVAAAVLVLAGVAASRGPAAAATFTALCVAWVVSGLLNTGIAAIQVFAPSIPDGDWIARSSIAGRAVGNLRQPNHLNSLLLWAAIALVGLLELRKVPWRLAAALMATLIFGVVLTASRTGVLGVIVLAAWALIDRRLGRGTRGILACSPLIYAVGWGFMAVWARLAQATFGGVQRLAEADLSSSRFAIWSDTIALIRDHPWTGVGFGDFNFAWSLSVLPNRPPAFFDHSHNLPLQLAVELGLPLAAIVVTLLTVALWRGVARGRLSQGCASLTARCSVAMVVLIGLHSLLEYPLWYSYFLLPTAFFVGLAVGPACEPADRPDARSNRLPWVAAALALVAGSLAAIVDYRRVVDIFATGDGVPPLQSRIERGRHSLLFAHHAEYAAATVAEDPALELRAFGQAAHHLIDTRLMMGWAQAYARSGDVDRAAYLVQRLREFRNPQSAAFLAQCSAQEAPSAAEPLFQCRPVGARLGWRDFR